MMPGDLSIKILEGVQNVALLDFGSITSGMHVKPLGNLLYSLVGSSMRGILQAFIDGVGAKEVDIERRSQGGCSAHRGEKAVGDSGGGSRGLQGKELQGSVWRLLQRCGWSTLLKGAVCGPGSLVWTIMST